MSTARTFGLLVALGMAGIATAVSTAVAQQAATRNYVAIPAIANDKLLPTLIGKWRGTCRTWFEPGKLADESDISGEFSAVLDKRFVRHTYQSTIQDKARAGEELLAFNSAAKAFETSWVDDFHMNSAILFSQGKRTAQGFSVRGDFDVGPGQPKWGWRTEYALLDANRLTITSFRVHPGGTETKVVEVAYRRIK
jgi:hypothetical protein